MVWRATLSLRFSLCRGLLQLSLAKFTPLCSFKNLVKFSLQADYQKISPGVTGNDVTTTGTGMKLPLGRFCQRIRH